MKSITSVIIFDIYLFITKDSEVTSIVLNVNTMIANRIYLNNSFFPLEVDLKTSRLFNA